jgi:hypothetical protein
MVQIIMVYTYYIKNHTKCIAHYGIKLVHENKYIIFLTSKSIIVKKILTFDLMKIDYNNKFNKNKKTIWLNIIKKFINNLSENYDSKYKYYNILNELLFYFAPINNNKTFFSCKYIEECPICFELNKLVKLHNSNHFVCMDCFLKISNCPICREKL